MNWMVPIAGTGKQGSPGTGARTRQPLTPGVYEPRFQLVGSPGTKYLYRRDPGASQSEPAEGNFEPLKKGVYTTTDPALHVQGIVAVT